MVPQALKIRLVTVDEHSRAQLSTMASVVFSALIVCAQVIEAMTECCFVGLVAEDGDAISRIAF